LTAAVLVGCSSSNKGAFDAKQRIGRICARAHEHPLLAVSQLARVRSPPPGQEAAYRQWRRAVFDYILDLAKAERLIRQPLPPKLTRSTAKRIRRRLVSALTVTNHAAHRVDR